MAAKLASMLEDMNETEESLRSHETPFIRAIFMCDIERDIASLSANQVDRFIAACLQRGCHNSAIAVAASTRKLSQMLGRLPDLGSNFWNTWAAALIHGQSLRAAEDIVSHFRQHVFSGLFTTFLFCVTDDEGLSLFEMLLDRCSVNDKSILWQVLFCVTSKPSTSRLAALLRSSNDVVREMMPYYTEMTGHFPLLMVKKTEKQRFGGTHSASNDCLAMLYEAGLFAAFATSTLSQVSRMLAANLAVQHGMPDAVRFLYNAGVMNNRVLHELRQRLEKPDHKFAPDVDAHAAGQIREFVSHKASQPCSLLILCLRETSCLVGWGHARQRNIKALEEKLPGNLLHQLQLKDGRKILRP